MADLDEQQLPQQTAAGQNAEGQQDSVKRVFLGILNTRAHHFRPNRVGSEFCPGKKLINCDPADAAAAGNLGLLERLRSDGKHCTTTDADVAEEEGLTHVVQYLRRHGVMTSQAVLQDLLECAGSISTGDCMESIIGDWDGVTRNIKGRVCAVGWSRSHLTGLFHEIVMSTELSRFAAEYANDTGSIAGSIGQLRHLQFLNLSHNQLRGKCSPSVLKLRRSHLSRTTHHVCTTQKQLSITGQIPESIATLTKLQRLNLSHNTLTGIVPAFARALLKLSLTIPPLMAVIYCRGDS